MQVVTRLSKMNPLSVTYSKFLQKAIWRRMRKFHRQKLVNLLNNLFHNHPKRDDIVPAILEVRDRLTANPSFFDLNKELVNVFDKLR